MNHDYDDTLIIEISAYEAIGVILALVMLIATAYILGGL